MTDNYDVKRIGKEAVIVSHPVITPQFYGLNNPDEFWAQSREEQRKQAIQCCIDSIDWEESDPMVIARLVEDAPGE